MKEKFKIYEVFAKGPQKRAVSQLFFLFFWSSHIALEWRSYVVAPRVEYIGIKPPVALSVYIKYNSKILTLYTQNG